MAGIHERWEAQQRSRWMRPDAARYLRPDIERYFTPAAWQAMTPAQRGQLSGTETERKGHVVTEPSVEELQRERSWLARQKLELLELYDLHLRLKAQLYSEKYSPNQPRVPKGNPDGGQWTSYGGGSGRGGRVQVADLRSGRGGINDRRVISDADPEPPLNGPTAAWYRDPNDPLGLNKRHLQGGGGGGRSGSGGSLPHSTDGGTIYTTPRGQSIVAPKGYAPSEARNEKGLVLSPKGQDPNNDANIIRVNRGLDLRMDIFDTTMGIDSPSILLPVSRGQTKTRIFSRSILDH